MGYDLGILRTERGRENGKEDRVFGLSGVGIKPKIKGKIKEWENAEHQLREAAEHQPREAERTAKKKGYLVSLEWV